MTVDVNNPKQKRSRVWLNDEEVSRWCVYADDVTGLVKLWKHNDEGSILAPKLLEDHYGRVRIVCSPGDTDTLGEPKDHQ